jgi:hypothetical protein
LAWYENICTQIIVKGDYEEDWMEHWWLYTGRDHSEKGRIGVILWSRRIGFIKGDEDWGCYNPSVSVEGKEGLDNCPLFPEWLLQKSS